METFGIQRSLFVICYFSQVIEEMSIQANVPALAMEEVKKTVYSYANAKSWHLDKRIIPQYNAIPNVKFGIYYALRVKF